ncbi:MAG TPA: amidase [Solirubrobacteraceae bacterium]|jgi:amidase|nr:amidase [Solirubrobacteraceae bacterium]
MPSTSPPSASPHRRPASARPTGLRDCAAALAAGETTSAELVEEALGRIEATQSTLNAFRIVCAGTAQTAAREADEQLERGRRLPLLGVPVAVKDDVDVAGEPTSFGCSGSFPPARVDSEMVRRLRAAGAIIIGKTNTPEIGLYPFTEGYAFGVTRNPWSLDHTPGGSSGGSAAAVAAGIVPAAVGSDGAGSVRIPASWCNLVGVKPQRGRISTWPDRESFNGLTCFGPLTRTVADAALMLDVLSGNHPEDLHAPPAASEPYAEAVEREPRRLRIALSLRHPYSAARVELHPEIRAATLRLVGVLGELGHDVIEADPRYGLMGLALVARGEAGVHEWAQRVPDRSLLDRRTRETARLGGVLARSVLPLARRFEPLLHRRIGSVFHAADVLITPTSAGPPLPIGATAGLGSRATQQVIAGTCPYAWPWNVLGWPGVSVPAGFTGEGLPVGVQLLGPANSEHMLLSLAAQLERVERWEELVAPHLASAQEYL